MSNPIVPGFVWQQAFNIVSEVILPTDTFRAQFRPLPNSPTLWAEIETGAGIVFENEKLFFYLTGEQTKNMKPHRAVTNLVFNRNGVEYPISQIINIPVNTLVTRP